MRHLLRSKNMYMVKRGVGAASPPAAGPNVSAERIVSVLMQYSRTCSSCPSDQLVRRVLVRVSGNISHNMLADTFTLDEFRLGRPTPDESSEHHVHDVPWLEDHSVSDQTTISSTLHISTFGLKWNASRWACSSVGASKFEIFEITIAQ